MVIILSGKYDNKHHDRERFALQSSYTFKLFHYVHEQNGWKMDRRNEWTNEDKEHIYSAAFSMIVHFPSFPHMFC